MVHICCTKQLLVAEGIDGTCWAEDLFRAVAPNYIILAGIHFRCFASAKLCILVFCVLLHLICNTLEWVLLTVFVPFPNSSMRTNELPVLLLRAWAIWRKIDTVVYYTLLFCFCVSLCLAVGSGWFIKCLNRWREWEKTWRALGAGGSPLFPHPHSLTDIRYNEGKNVYECVCVWGAGVYLYLVKVYHKCAEAHRHRLSALQSCVNSVHQSDLCLLCRHIWTNQSHEHDQTDLEMSNQKAVSRLPLCFKYFRS